MAEEIILILEYMLSNPVLKGAFTVYAIFAVFVIAFIIAVFVFVIQSFKELKRRRRK